MNTTLAIRPVLAPSIVRPAPVRLPWSSTPRRLLLLGAAVLFATLLLLLAARHAAVSARAALQTVGRDSAPSIVAAMRLRAAVSDLDANLVNQFLTAPDSKDRSNAVEAAQRRREEISATLVRAAENLTFGEVERAPLVRLVRDLPAYDREMSRALTLEERGDHDAALLVARGASDFVRSSLLASADALEKANRDALETTYARAGGVSEFARGGLLAALLLAIGALAVAQGFLAWRTRRRLNLGLLAATVVTLGFSFVAIMSVSSAASHLRAAKQDSFDSVSLLWRARALANDANGLESRWLFDAAQADIHSRGFFENVDRILRRPLGTDWARVPGDLRGQTPLPAGYGGLLVQALQNVTYAGEREALLQMADALAQYARTDGRVRELQGRGDRSAAVALCLSYAADGSNGAFDRFDTALERALAVNQEAFERQVTLGLEAVSGLEWTALATALGVAGATVAGLRPRLREYAA